MNLHTRLIGAIDAVFLTLTAAVMVTLLFVLIHPPAGAGRTAAAHESAQRQQA